MANIDPKLVFMTFYGKTLTGFADAPIKVNRGSSKVETKRGIQGDSEDVQKYDGVDSIVVSFLQTSDGCKTLEDYYDSRARGTCVVRDTNTDCPRVYKAVEAQVKEMGEISVGGEDAVEFTINCGQGITKG